jgi:hypothetical protein
VPIGFEKVCELVEQNKPEDLDKQVKPDHYAEAEPEAIDPISDTDTDAEVAEPGELPKPEITPPQHRANIWPMVLAGALVALLGFVAGKSTIFDRFLPTAWQEPVVDLSPIEAGLAALISANEGLQSEDAALRALIDNRDDTARLTAIIARLEERVSALENAPAPQAVPAGDDPDLDVLRRQLEAQQAALQQMQAQNAKAAQVAKDEARIALAQAASLRVLAAIDAGVALEAPLQDLAETGVVQIPDALADLPKDGIATLSQLQADFPALARRALANARDASGDGGVLDFIKRQLGARSVTPRVGDDPDAILSRAEAALRQGDLPRTLQELSALPDDPVLAPWVAAATARHQAQTAAQSLVADLKAR